MSEFDITLSGIVYPERRVTFNFNGTVDDANVGKAVSQDTTAGATVKLTADGDEIIGRLFSNEDRAQQGGGKDCVVELSGGFTLPYKAGETIAVGDRVVGAPNGEVRKKVTSGTPDTATGLLVWAVDTTAKTVTVLL